MQKRNADKKAQATADQDWTMLRYLSETLAKDEMQPRQFFKQIDNQKNGVLNVDQVKDGVKAWYPTAFDGLNYKKLERALDINKRGYLETDDFVRLMEESKTMGSNTKAIGGLQGSLAGKKGAV